MKIQDIYKKETGKEAMFFSGIGQHLLSPSYVEWLEKKATSKVGEFIKCPMVSFDFEDNTILIAVPESKMEEGFHGGSVLVDFSGVQD